MIKGKKYGSILVLGTLQFNGHFLEYLIKNSDKLVIYYLLPRGGNIKNFIEIYIKGKLKEKKYVYTPKNISLTYITYYFQYLKILFEYFSNKEKVYFINTLPVFFFFNSIIKLFRKFEIVYWVQDYWTMNNLSIKIFRYLMHYYHNRTKFTIYITDRINKMMNKKVLNEPFKKTVMWGVESPKNIFKKKNEKLFKVCFIGVLAPWQNIDLLLKTVGKNKKIYLKIIGTGNELLVKNYQDLIKELKIEDRVYFPNKFIYQKDLQKEVKDCHVGIALYETNRNSVSYYSDPSKIKQYAEFGLPIIMTNSSEIAHHIKKFKAGIIVDKDIEKINRAIEEIKINYKNYLLGLKQFSEHFYYKEYYGKGFKFLEEK